MTPRVRKFIGLLAIMAYLAAYVVLMTGIASRLPPNRAAWAAFYIVAGIGWGFPLFPLIKWMEQGRFWGRSGGRRS